MCTGSGTASEVEIKAMGTSITDFITEIGDTEQRDKLWEGPKPYYQVRRKSERNHVYIFDRDTGIPVAMYSTTASIISGREGVLEQTT